MLHKASLFVILTALLVCPAQATSASSELIITDFQASPNNIQLGETFTLSGRIMNAGSEPAYHVSIGTRFENISAEDWWYAQEIPSGPRSFTVLQSGEVRNFTLTLRAMTTATFDIGVYVIYTRSLESGVGTETMSRTIRMEVTRAPPQIPSWLNWWTLVALAIVVTVLGWRLRLLERFRRMWKTLIVVVSAMTAVGAIVYVTVLNTRWMPALIFGLPLIAILQGFASKSALAGFLTPVAPTVVVTSAVEMLHLLPHYYPPGGVLLPLTFLALLTGLMGSGVALRRQGKAMGTILLGLGLLVWLLLWLHSLTSG